MMNPDEDHQEHNNILMIRMFTQIFKLKLVGPRTHGTRPLITLQWLQEPKNSINISERLNITYTTAKQQEKQQEHYCEALAIKLIITEIPRNLFKCKSILSYLV